MLDAGRGDAVDRLRSLLEAHGYAGPEATAALGAPIGSEHRPADLPLYLRRLDAQRPLHALLKLFALHTPLPEPEVRTAIAPVSVEEMAALGLVERAEGLVRPLVALEVAEGLVLARDRPDPVTFAVRPDHVLGVSPPALLLAHLTVRRAARRVLDLGCGGGIQALLASRHAQSVVGVDLNARALAFARFNARLNDIRNVEWREGDLFAPVGGERFDLVVSNPPYVVSPESWLLFRDGGGAGDGICARIVGGLGDHLAEGGFATVLGNWALREGERWADPPRRWVEGTGCDAWVLRSETQDPLTYAAVWTRGPEEAGYADALERWRAHYEALSIRSLVMGALVLRKRAAGPCWVRADELPATPDRDASAALQRVFAGEDRLRAIGTNAALLEEVLRVAEPLRLRQTVAFRDGVPEVQEAELSLADGLPVRGGADAGTIRLVQLCDGRRRLREVVAEMARSGGTDAGALVEPTLAVARRLVALGFLEPAGP
jgi:methylase of polypeptide subunit release factors